MKQALTIIALLCLCACTEQQTPTPQFGNAKVYTTPGGVGGVSYTKYEVTPL
jgi:hypothetical protein